MSALSGRLGGIPARWRWVGLAVIVALTVFLVWFFIFRHSESAPSPAGSAPPPRPALGKRIPYATYSAAVDQALGAVHDAGSLQGDALKKKLESAAATLEQVEGASVEPPSGGISVIDNTAIIAELRSSEPNLGALDGSLTALSQSLHEAPGAQPVAGTLEGQKAKVE
ncbi:MAG: hypothetical protein ACJ78Q_17330, partial [Chloroflexia bacterium]